MSISRMSRDGDQPPRCLAKADCKEHCEAAGAFAQAVVA